MKRILVTGSQGFLASRFIDFYKDKYEITSFNRNEFDITSERNIFYLFKDNKFDLVFHTAAISDTQYSERYPEIANWINVQGTKNIARGCNLCGATLIFASSDQVYNGNTESGPYSENISLSPNSVYAQSKLDAENSIKNVIDNYYNLRLTWLFSMAERNKKVNTNIITNILSSTLKNSPISLSNNEFRGMTYVYDLIENIDKLTELPYGDYNFGSENDLSTYEIGVKVLESMNLSNRINDIIIKDTKRFNANPRDLRIDTNKLKNYKLTFPNTEEAIEKCIRDFKFIY